MDLALVQDRIRIADVVVSGRHRRDLGDLAALAESMAKIGLLHPIVVDEHGRLIAGRRRLQAANSLGWREIPATVARNLNEAALALRAECDENSLRRALRPSEMVSIARALEPHVAGNLPAGRVNDQLAAAVGTSRRTLEKARAVVEAAEGDPTLSDLVAGMDRIGKVDRAYRLLRLRTQAVIFEQAGERDMPLPFDGPCIIDVHDRERLWCADDPRLPGEKDHLADLRRVLRDLDSEKFTVDGSIPKVMPAGRVRIQVRVD